MEGFMVLTGILYIAYLIHENLQNKKVRSQFKHVIHVNGTRGKSTVCRLIDAGLREAGFKVFTKTTGTSPRIIHTDGRETEIKRKGKANIREQLKTMKLAAFEKAEILVIECMAVKPELQFVCENNMIMADIGVITNARMDHLEEMGSNLSQIIHSLSMTIPKNGVLFTADKTAYSYYKKLKHNTNVSILLADEKKTDFKNIDFEENVALAYSVCKYLGVDIKTAMTGMKKYKKDPGRLKTYNIKNKNNVPITFINAFAANDPDSTLRIYKNLNMQYYSLFDNRILLINNRIDRVSRMNQYVDFILNIGPEFDNIWITGDLKRQMKKKVIKRKAHLNKINLLSDIKHIDSIERPTLIFGVGNIGGYGKTIVSFFEKAGGNSA